MANNTKNGHIELNEVTSRNQLNGDVQNHLHTNGHNERSNLMSPSKLDIIQEGRSDVNTTSDVRHLASNRRTEASTDATDSRTGRLIESGPNDVDPLLETEFIPTAKPQHPPIAHPELDDDEPDGDNVPKTPQYHPGVDDGFFPDIGPRVGDDDPKRDIPPNGDVPFGRRPSVNNFPFAPGFNPLEGTPQIIPDVNVYQHKKTLGTFQNVSHSLVLPLLLAISVFLPLFPISPVVEKYLRVFIPEWENLGGLDSGLDKNLLDEIFKSMLHKCVIRVLTPYKTQGMMDLALLSANANQLRYVLESYGRHPYYYFSLVFISLSLILQIAVGIGLILNSRYDVRKEADICKADRINNFTILGIFLVTIVNVFVSSFGVADPPPGV